MSDETPRTAWGIYERQQDSTMLAGPHGFLYDKAVAEQVAAQLYGPHGVVQETNPDHCQQWGYGKGSPYGTRLGETSTAPKPFDRVAVGETAVDLLFGEHPHSRRDNNIYARFPDGRMEGFDGHRVLCTVLFQDYNYLKTSGLSGNEVRKGGTCTITMNGFQCATFFYRDLTWALLEAHRQIAKIQDFDVHLWQEEDRAALVGRKVYYRNHPAIITAFYEEDMDVILMADGGTFPLAAYQQERDAGEMWDDEETAHVKDSIFSPHIWWYRRDPQPEGNTL